MNGPILPLRRGDHGAWRGYSRGCPCPRCRAYRTWEKSRRYARRAMALECLPTPAPIDAEAYRSAVLAVAAAKGGRR